MSKELLFFMLGETIHSDEPYLTHLVPFFFFYIFGNDYDPWPSFPLRYKALNPLLDK